MFDIVLNTPLLIYIFTLCYDAIPNASMKWSKKEITKSTLTT